MAVKKVDIYILIVLIVVMLVVFGGIQQYMQKQNEMDNYLGDHITEEPSPLHPEKEEKIIRFANEIIDEHPIEGCVMIPLYNKIIANDQYNRYLVEVDTIALKQYTSNGAYTYYIVVQENVHGDLYILPFGIEVLDTLTDSLEKEIIISTMKVANGWGSTSEAFQQRLENALIAHIAGQLNTNRIMRDFSSVYVKRGNKEINVLDVGPKTVDGQQILEWYLEKISK